MCYVQGEKPLCFLNIQEKPRYLHGLGWCIRVKPSIYKVIIINYCLIYEAMIPLCNCLLNFMLFMQFMTLATWNISVLNQWFIFACMLRYQEFLETVFLEFFSGNSTLRERQSLLISDYINFRCSISGSLNFFLTIWQVLILKVNIYEILCLW